DVGLERHNIGAGQLNERAVAISAFDLPGSTRLLVHGCEDCACAVSATESLVRDHRQPEPAAAGSRLARSTSVFEYELDDLHRLLFQPVGDGEVVVVNESAYRIFRGF